MHVIGTAGHVDHGKSTLVEALTGIHPDRLKEEREREMTIDLGFAWLALPGHAAVGLIDVPGHRDFIENMLAGVGGIDAALFVVAADEGVMPQTREHLAILDLLQIPAGVVALTKIDLVPDAEWLALVTAELAGELAGTVLAAAPIVPVSARSGAGLDALRAALAACLDHAPARPDRGRPRMPVDRVFTIAGFGTVVTGTLSDGQFALGDEVEIVPRGLRARIRGLQTHYEKIATAQPGSRVAINLSGVSTGELARGDVVAQPGRLTGSLLVDVQLKMLPDAALPLRHNGAVKFFCGSAERMARMRLLGVDELRPGETGLAQLSLAEPVGLAAGDRFILRVASPGATIAGGRIVDPQPGRRHRRYKPEVLERLAALVRGTPAALVEQALDRHGPLTAARALEAAGMRSAGDDPAGGQALLRELVEAGSLVTLGAGALGPDTWITTRAGWSALAAQLGTQLAAFHAANPLRPGMPREELKSRLKLEPRAFAALVARAVAVGLAVSAADGSGLRAPTFAVRFSPDQQRRIDGLQGQLARDPRNTPLVKDVQAALGADVYQALLDGGTLVQVAPEVFFDAETYEDLVSAVRSQLAARGRLTVAEARDLLGTTRKYALALLEHLDQKGVTVRKGDERVARMASRESSGKA